MSTFLHPGATYRIAFKRVAVRQQFRFVSGAGPGGVWVKTGTGKYAAPTPEKHTVMGKVLPCTVTGRVKYWQGATFFASAGTLVQLVYPFEVMTEAVMHDW